MESEREKKPFVIEFKSNYGTTMPRMNSPPAIYSLHGQSQVEIIGHCHRDRSEGTDKKARRKLLIASGLCLFFMVAEIVGGILSNSLAIATDAAHLLTDFASFMISLFAIWLAGRPSTQRMSFGWYRAEVIGAMASVVMIWVITGILVWLAVQRVITGDYELNAKYMLITSILAIVVNVIMGFQLHHSHGHAHGHGHGHGHGSSPPADTTVSAIRYRPNSATEAPPQMGVVNEAAPQSPGSQGNSNEEQTGPANETNSRLNVKAVSSNKKQEAPKENINVRAAFIHVLGDVLQSIGVFIAALVIYFKPEWAIADPICTFVFSIIVLFTTFSIMKDALLVLMEGTPTYLEYTEVMDVFLQIEGVERVHNLRIWALSINKIALSAHLAIKAGANPFKILEDATSAVHLKYNFFETTIQIEDFTPEMENCQQCNSPDT